MNGKMVALAGVTLLVSACTGGITDARTATPAHPRMTGSGCIQSFSPTLAGPSSTWANLIVDGSLESGCADWMFPDVLSNRVSGTGSQGSWFAQMQPYTGFTKTKFYQDINLVDPSNGHKALPKNVTFFVNTLSSSGSSSFDQYQVKLIDPGTGAVLKTVTTTTALVPAAWKYYSFDLTLPLSSYSNSVRLQFEGTVFDANTRFQFDDVRFWAQP